MNIIIYTEKVFLIQITKQQESKTLLKRQKFRQKSNSIFQEPFINHSKKEVSAMNSFTKGVIAGAVLGAGMSMLVNPVDSQDVKRIQRSTSRFFSNVGNIIDSVLDQ